MKQERRVISKGAIRKGYSVTPTVQVVYITTDEKTGKKTSMTKHEVLGSKEEIIPEEPITAPEEIQ